MTQENFLIWGSDRVSFNVSLFSKVSGFKSLVSCKAEK